MKHGEAKRMTLTKAELVDILIEKIGLNKREARDMVDSFFEEIRRALEKKEAWFISSEHSYLCRYGAFKTVTMPWGWILQI